MISIISRPSIKSSHSEIPNYFIYARLSVIPTWVGKSQGVIQGIGIPVVPLRGMPKIVVGSTIKQTEDDLH